MCGGDQPLAGSMVKDDEPFHWTEWPIHDRQPAPSYSPCFPPIPSAYALGLHNPHSEAMRSSGWSDVTSNSSEPIPNFALWCEAPGTGKRQLLDPRGSQIDI